MNNVTKWKSTVLGLISLLIPVMVVVGWITPEKQGPIMEHLPVLVESIFVLVGAVMAFIGIWKLNDDG
jgi:hypothetical protein